MIVDVDHAKRMELLVSLMRLEPDKSMKKLQREALKYYPLYYNNSIRMWMGSNIAMKAAEILNKEEGLI